MVLKNSVWQQLTETSSILQLAIKKLSISENDSYIAE